MFRYTRSGRPRPGVKAGTNEDRARPDLRIVSAFREIEYLFVAAITERTAVVVLSHAYYQSAALIDVPAIVARAKQTSTLVVLDSYQTTGIVPYDVTALDVDIVVGA